MSLKEKLEHDAKEALKSGDSFRVEVLRMLTATLKNKEIEKRSKDNEILTDEEIESLLRTEVKKRKEAATQYSEGGRSELKEKEEKEMAVIEAYLPKQMKEDDVRKVVQDMFSKDAPSSMGEAMKSVMAELKGKADGQLVSRIVKEQMS